MRQPRKFNASDSVERAGTFFNPHVEQFRAIGGEAYFDLDDPSKRLPRHKLHDLCKQRLAHVHASPPRSFKPERIANVEFQIQIVDTYDSLKTRVNIGLAAFLPQLNRTLLIYYTKVSNLNDTFA